MGNLTLSRRDLAMAVLGSIPLAARAQSESQLGNLYPSIQALADASPLELSFLRREFQDHSHWQSLAREKLFDLLQYRSRGVPPEAHVITRTQREGFIEERLTFRSVTQSLVPASLLLPTNGRAPFPAVVVLHDHGGFYMWGREKVIGTENEHPVLTDFKQRYYSGHSIANDLVRQGFAVIAIDMFYWGERRYLLPDDPVAWRERSSNLTEQQVSEFNRRSSQKEEFVARSLLTAGTTWPGVILGEDLQTLDYLASRPEVDRNRIACVGLSVGGYRSFMLAALDSRIKAAVDVGWMTTFASQIKQHVIYTMGLTFVIPGMYRYFDLPDLGALIAPRALMVQMGSQDKLFSPAGVQAAFAKIDHCYRKVGSPDRQSCKLFDVPHQFNKEMQSQAWEWLKVWV
jgi:dienelactone hydrolase